MCNRPENRPVVPYRLGPISAVTIGFTPLPRSIEPVVTHVDSSRKRSRFSPERVTSSSDPVEIIPFGTDPRMAMSSCVPMKRPDRSSSIEVRVSARLLTTNSSIIGSYCLRDWSSGAAQNEHAVENRTENRVSSPNRKAPRRVTILPPEKCETPVPGWDRTVFQRSVRR